MSEPIKSPDQILCASDTGDDVQRRFRYQASFIAIVCLDMMADSSEFEAVYCEHHEDILIKRKDGLYIGIQVKTRDDGEAFKSGDAAIIKSLKRFLALEAEFPDQFAHFALVTNTGFWHKQANSSNLEYLITLSHSGSDQRPQILTTFLNKIASTSDPNCCLACTMLSKIRLQSSTHLDGIYNDVVEKIAALDGADQRPHASIRRAATRLVETMLAASSLPSLPMRQYLALQDDPDQVYIQAVITKKRITRQTVHQILQEVLFAPQAQDAVHQLGQSISAELSPVREQRVVLDLRPSDAITSSEHSSEQVYNARVDIVRDLLQRGQPEEARFVLDKLRKEVTEAGIELSKTLQARIENNYGACAFDLADWDTAVYHFRRAQELDPAKASYLANEANIALIKRDNKAALRLSERARQIDPRETNAVSVYMQALHDLGRTTELEQLVAEEEWILQDPISAAALGLIYHDAGRDQEAEPLLRNALIHMPENVQIHITLASTIVGPIMQRLISAGGPPWQMDATDRVRLEEAEAILTQAIERSERFDNHAPMQAALISRSGVHNLLGAYEQGLQDCERVLMEDPDQVSALENKSRILMDIGRESEAIPCIEAVLSHEEPAVPAFYINNRTADDKAMVARMLAYAYLKTGQTERIPPLLAPFWKPSVVELGQLAIAELLLIAYDYMHDTHQMEATLQVVASMWKEHPDALSVQAYALIRAGRMDEATLLFQKARDLAEGVKRNRLTLELADHLYAQGQFDAAVPLYAQVVDRTFDSPSLRKYAVALFNSGQYRAALALTQEFRQNGDPVPVLGDIEAQVREYIGDLSGARELHRKMISLPVHGVKHRLQGALLDLRMGSWISAQHEIEQITLEQVQDDPDALIRIAQVRVALQMPDAMPFAYRAKKIAPDIPEIQVAYFSVLVRREKMDATILQPQVVGPECVVILRRGTESRTYKFVAGTANLENQEISISDRLADKMLGKQVGQEVEISPGLIFEIVEIQSKYVYSFQSICRDFHTRFGDFPSFQKFEVKDDDISEMLAMIDERHQNVMTVMDLYRQKSLPLCFVAKRIGRSLIEMWVCVTRSPNHKFFVAAGNEQETKNEEVVVAATEKLVLDLPAILTVLHLEIVDVLKARFTKLYVSQWTLDAINQELAVEFSDGQEGGTIGKDGDHYFFLESSEEAFLKRRQFIERVRDFIQQHTEAMPANLLLDIPEQERTQLEETIGRSALGAMLVAKEQQSLLYSDDMMFRAIAKQSWQVDGCCCQAILRELWRSGHLSEEAYYDAVAQLAQANYSYLNIDLAGLLFVLERNAYEINDRVRSVFGLFQGPDCSDEAAITALSEVVKKVWPKILMEHQKVFVLDLALETLVRGRSGKPVVDLFQATIRYKFHFMSQYLPEIQRHIRVWRTQHLI